MPAPPYPPGLLDSATVVLLREGGGQPFELFLMCRHQKQSFMGGAHVFPGGRLDEADSRPELTARVCDLTPAEAQARLQDSSLSPEKALALHLCVVRELFEEAGVVMAQKTDGSPLSLERPEVAARFAEHRRRLHGGEISLAEIAATEGLVFALKPLVPYAHWITPEIEKKRFSTRFFLARLPHGQIAAHDHVELVHSHWLTPAQALEQQADQKIVLMPPTLKTVAELGRFDSAEAALADARGRTLGPILPQAFQTEGGFGVMLPHDPDYRLEGFRREPRPGEISRVVMRAGKWRLEKSN